jgi:hypothetical protein
MADLKEAFRRLDPASALDDDPLEAYVLRPGDPVGKLVKILDFSESPRHILLAGQRGVGKTTELQRLRNLLKWNSFPLLHQLERTSISNPPAGITRLTEDLAQNAARVVGSLSNFSLFHPRNSLGITTIHTEFLRLIEDLRKANINPFLLVDGLEKVRGREIREVVRFVGELGQLDCTVIAVAPLGLTLLPEYGPEVAEWDRVVTLPAVSIRTRDGAPDDEGCGLLRTVIESRVGGHVFEGDALKFLVEQSAGIHRELLSLAQDACLSASIAGHSRVAFDHIQSAVEERRLAQSSRLTTHFLKALDHVRQHKRIASNASLLPLLELNLVVAYQDASIWFDVNPIVEPLIDAYL